MEIKQGLITTINLTDYGQLAWELKDALGKKEQAKVKITQKGKEIHFNQGEENFVNLREGKYDVELDFNSALNSKHPNVEIIKGTTTTLEISGHGRLNIIAKPIEGKGAPRVNIYQKGKLIAEVVADAGSTFDLPPGIYDLKFWNVGTTDTERKGIVIKAGEETTVEVGGYGRLKFKVVNKAGEETGGAVYLRQIGKTIHNNWLSVLDLSEGTYDLKLFISGSGNLEKKGVRIHKGKITTLIIKGKEITVVPGKTARLNFIARDALGKNIPAKVRIFWDSAKGADSPLKQADSKAGASIDLKPGKYTVDFDFTAENFKDVSFKDIVLKDREERTLVADNFGRVQISVTDKSGKDVSYIVTPMYHSDNEKSAAYTISNKAHYDLPPDTYDFMFYVEGERIWKKNIAVSKGKITTVKVVVDKKDTQKNYLQSWLGVWNTNRGEMRIGQQGDMLAGEFFYHRGGKFEGTLTSPTQLRGIWTIDFPSLEGDFELNLSADGKSFKGQFNEERGAQMDRSWTGIKK